MTNPIADATMNASTLMASAQGCVQSVWNLLVAVLTYGDTSAQAQSAQTAVYDAYDAAAAISVDDPCPGACGTGLSSAAANLLSVAGNSFEGSYDPNQSISTQASQAIEGYSNAVNAAIGGVMSALANINSKICQCDYEATGGANDSYYSCYQGSPIGGGPAPNTQWWHTFAAECPTWNEHATPHQCQCYEDPM
jgi:hypothetical protein